MNYVPLDQLTFARFAQLLNSRFLVHISPAASVELKLVETTSVHGGQKSSSTDQASENFSLIFNGPAERRLPQQIYLFEHGKLGAFELFIVPIGKEHGNFRYQAIFNRSARPR